MTRRHFLPDMDGVLVRGTVLVMSGMTSRDAVLARSPYQPHHVVDSVADIELG